MTSTDIHFVFFGTPDIAVQSLETLRSAGLLPKLIITAPDKPAGRGLRLQSSPVQQWADTHSIETLQPQKIDDAFVDTLQKRAPKSGWDVFVVVAYGKILPQRLIDLPHKGTLNMHPSLLPKYRGPSPIEAQILANDREVGVTVMRIDEKMDHGPLLMQEHVAPEQWPTDAPELERLLGSHGATLLAETLPAWVRGDIDEQEQNHESATYCKMIRKEDAEISLSDDPYQNYLKFLAYQPWPRVFFFAENGKRIVITDAAYTNNTFTIKRVIPEGKKEMPYETFLKSI